MIRTIGFVPVRVGRGVVPVLVQAEVDAMTHVDLESSGGARIVVPEGLTSEGASREVETMLPEVQLALARKLLN
ncbi:MAG: hypothetical protein WCJ30_19000 [Deltaproteobacteria bacterium]